MKARAKFQKKTRKFNVSLRGRVIDSVFCTSNPGEKLVDVIDDVKRGLVHHDGYDPDISVRVARR